MTENIQQINQQSRKCVVLRIEYYFTIKKHKQKPWVRGGGGVAKVREWRDCITLEIVWEGNANKRNNVCEDKTKRSY
jgi:hypothetical protein